LARRGWHARRKFLDLARLNKAPIAIEAVERTSFPNEMVEMALAHAIDNTAAVTCSTSAGA
jgi:hypothetical protein